MAKPKLKFDCLTLEKHEEELGAKKGEELIDTLLQLTGLPESSLRQELDGAIDKTGHNPKDLTLDELRAVMIEYLEKLNEEMQASEDCGELEASSLPPLH